MSDYMQVVTTVDSAKDAERLGRNITSAHLAAYVQIVGLIRSLYWFSDISRASRRALGVRIWQTSTGPGHSWAGRGTANTARMCASLPGVSRDGV
jgi:hypothetical protein